jgi:hypothetical protein
VAVVAHDVTFEFINAEESWQIFDWASRRLLGMSADDFVAKWEAGEFNDEPTSEAWFVSTLRPA